MSERKGKSKFGEGEPTQITRERLKRNDNEGIDKSN